MLRKIQTNGKSLRRFRALFVIAPLGIFALGGCPATQSSLDDEITKIVQDELAKLPQVAGSVDDGTDQTIVGPVGPEGAQGPQGPQGPAGPAGADGAQGKPGATGANGATGPTGATGPKGDAGPTGATGATGAPGAQGPQGQPGEHGEAGAAGAVGPQGPAGAAGEPGAAGAPGATGAAGPQGPQGEPGATGATGATGAPGAAGPQGEQGAPGPQGPPGATGAPGAVGPQGPAGPPGPVGEAGAVGPAGPAGAVGAAGPQGEMGPAGPQGPMGPQGPSGADGAAGPQGEMGPAGPQGEVGPQGPPGTNANILVGAGLARDGDTVSLDLDFANGNFFRIGGNSGAASPLFLGAADDVALHLGISGAAALRLEPGLVASIIGGNSDNFITPGLAGALVLGGGIADDGTGVAALNSVTADFASVLGGLGNSANTYAAIVAGGRANSASGNYAGVFAGFANNTNAYAAVVVGGESNAANGAYSVALGRRAKAEHSGSLVFADTTEADFSSQRANQFSVRAYGGARFAVGPVMTIEMRQVDNKLISASNGAFLSLGGTWTNASDRASKENITPADLETALRQLDTLPIYHWNYIMEGAGVPRMGPMADDFRRTFGLGEDEQHIGTVDVDGVALASIKALSNHDRQTNAQVTALQSRVAALESQNDDLQRRLAALEAAVARLGGAGGP